jgi:8-oxo-dGTP pyrophosphatase MutT (NUDIX family)
VGISPYLRHLRESVGHDLLLIPAVAVFPWDGDGRLLMVREADTGLWQTVGGAIDPDESPLDAAVREAAEETGAVVGIEGVRAVAGGPQFRLTYPNGDQVSYVSIMFDARVLEGTPRADGDETIEVGWFSPRQLAELHVTDFTAELFRIAGVPENGTT